MMRSRHKTPTIVSMWMLDVFCCALGCVTLLWLLNTRTASDEARRAESSIRDLATTKQDLIALQTQSDAKVRALNVELENLNAKLLATTTERDATAQKLAVATTDIRSLEQNLATSKVDAKELEDLLARKQTDAKDLTVKLSVSEQAADALRKLLREKTVSYDDALAKSQAVEVQLSDADAKLRALAKANDDAKANLSAMRKTGDELSQAQAKSRDLQAKLDAASANLIDLQGDKAKLADKFDKLRLESDTKFAGIAMTGRRVVFAVDVSGSMKLLDDKTPAPNKWPTVVETVTRVMRSLPDLTQFQVIVFSKKARYLIGDGGWINYQGDDSLADVRAGLLAVDPLGDTNMYDAFDLAFKLRSQGLDTIYLFSDGLPTSGAGLTPEQERSTADGVRVGLLSQHVRQTLLQTWNTPRGGQRVRINAVGFFFESNEVGAFLWALTRDNDGSFVGMSKP